MKKGKKSDEAVDLAKEMRQLKVSGKKKPIPLDAAALIHVINELKTGEPLIITTETEVPLRKSVKIEGQPFENPWIGDKVIKRSRIATRARPDFGEELKRARQARGLEPREVKRRKWGQRLAGTPYVVHMRKGEAEIRMYLEVIVLRVLDHHYYFEPTGEEIAAQRLKPYMFKRSESKTETQEGVIWRDYNIRHIVLLEAKGKHYVIAPNFRLPSESEATLLRPAKARAPARPKELI